MLAGRNLMFRQTRESYRAKDPKQLSLPSALRMEGEKSVRSRNAGAKKKAEALVAVPIYCIECEVLLAYADAELTQGKPLYSVCGDCYPMLRNSPVAAKESCSKLDIAN